MEIRSLEIDFDKEVLKINGEEIKETPVIVTLPGPDGWPLRKVINPELVTRNEEESNKLEVCCSENFVKVVNNKPL